MIKVLVNNSPTKVRVFFVTAKQTCIFLEIFFSGQLVNKKCVFRQKK